MKKMTKDLETTEAEWQLVNEIETVFLASILNSPVTILSATIPDCPQTAILHTTNWIKVAVRH